MKKFSTVLLLMIGVSMNSYAKQSYCECIDSNGNENQEQCACCESYDPANDSCEGGWFSVPNPDYDVPV